jgi:glucose/arabinose dehydrogenase
VSARARRVAVLAAAFAAVAGCTSGDDENGSASAEETTPAQSESARTGAGPPPAQPAARQVRLLRLGSFDEPTYVTAPRGDRRRFVVERPGRIRVVKRGKVLRTPFLDISAEVTTGGESGLLSMAFPPDYAGSGRFYVYYTDRAGYLRIAQFRRSAGSADRADAGSERLVMRVPHHRSNHKGGQLQFGPDGHLYAGFGDGGGGGDPDRNAQNRSRQLGKLIRIAPRASGGYSVPADNPFRARSGARPENYAYGLRNPYRFSFDRRTGDLAIGDVGQDAVEEIDFVENRRGGGRAPRGGYNFGWNVFEGRSRYGEGRARGHVPPVLAHSQDAGYCSIIGGYVIRDRSLGKGLYGKYVYGDYCKTHLRLATLRPRGSRSRELSARVSNLVSFGEDGRGRVYAVSLDGPVYRLARR